MMIQQWDEVMRGGIADQAALETVLRRCTGANPGVRADECVRIGVLPPHLFANGHTFFVQRLHEVRLRLPCSWLSSCRQDWSCQLHDSLKPDGRTD